jgi:hypothetical protein
VTAVRAPDLVAPVVGWRYWRVAPDGRLTSLGAGRQDWPPGRALRARCRRARLDHLDARWGLVDGFGWAPHTAPGESCSCGIYAARDLAALRTQRLFGLRYHAAGEVALWGTIVPGELGFRAEFAYPKSIKLIRSSRGRDAPTVRRLQAYGVPVELVARGEVGYSVGLALTRVTQRVVGGRARGSAA